MNMQFKTFRKQVYKHAFEQVYGRVGYVAAIHVYNRVLGQALDWIQIRDQVFDDIFPTSRRTPRKDHHAR